MQSDLSTSSIKHYWFDGENGKLWLN